MRSYEWQPVIPIPIDAVFIANKWFIDLQLDEGCLGSASPSIRNSQVKRKRSTSRIRVMFHDKFGSSAATE
jgi:hypothetical protein